MGPRFVSSSCETCVHKDPMTVRERERASERASERERERENSTNLHRRACTVDPRRHSMEGTRFVLTLNAFTDATFSERTPEHRMWRLQLPALSLCKSTCTRMQEHRQMSRKNVKCASSQTSVVSWLSTRRQRSASNTKIFCSNSNAFWSIKR